MRALLLALCCGLLSACSTSDDTLGIEDAWIATAPPQAKMRAGYVTLHNPGDTAWQLVSASSTEFGSIQLHDIEQQDGMMRMRHRDQLPLPAGESLELAPGGAHLMLMQPREYFTEGQNVPITLTIETADGTRQTAQVNFTVKPRTPE